MLAEQARAPKVGDVSSVESCFATEQRAGIEPEPPASHEPCTETPRGPPKVFPMKNAAGTRVQVIVAHPDDETFGCGSLLLHARSSGAATHVVDTTDFWQQRWTAIRAHRSQTSPFEGLPDDLARAFLCREHLCVMQSPLAAGLSK